MDQKEDLTGNQKLKNTRATARHLRRKKLKEARKAEKQLVESGNNINHSNKNANIKTENSEVLISNIRNKPPHNIADKQEKINEHKTSVNNDTEVSKIEIQPYVISPAPKSELIDDHQTNSINKGSVLVNEVPHTKYSEAPLENRLTVDIEQKSTTIANISSSIVVPSTLNKMTDNEDKSTEKSREQIKAEREAKKAAKAAAKSKSKAEKGEKKGNIDKPVIVPTEVKKESNNKKGEVVSVKQVTIENDIASKKATVPSKEGSAEVKNEGKSKAELRAERRAKQELQRAAKQEQLAEKAKLKSKETTKPQASPAATPATEGSKKVIKKPVVTENSHEVSLFKHLYHERELALRDVPVVNSKIHPTIIRLGVQYANKVIVGSNARCVALLEAVKRLIQDFERPPQADFVRGLEAALQDSAVYLHHCRPLAVSMQNALRHLKWQMTQLPSSLSDENAKERLKTAIETYYREQIDLAGEAISATIQSKISNGNVILTYGYSSLIHKILLDAHKKGTQFRVVVVDGRPQLEGKEQLRRLAKCGIDCTYILINALSFIMPEVSKVFLGAHAILANGAVMSRVGTAQIALMARAYNVPVLVACETHKSCERVQTDSIVYNELGDADELTQNLCNSKKSVLANWRTKKYLNLLNITYDVTPADLVTAVVTELAILPCTSVPVILRIKPSEI